MVIGDLSVRLMQLIDRSATGTKFYQNKKNKGLWQTELWSYFAFLYHLYPEFAMSLYFSVHKECDICQVPEWELQRRKMNQPLQWFVE